MTKRQKFAFDHPCLTERQCAEASYRWIKHPWSAILTLNIGLDDCSLFDDVPVWHCSIARFSSAGHLRPLAFWDDAMLASCLRSIRDEILGGAGDQSREQIQLGDSAVHLIRCCSETEIEELNARGVWPRSHDRARWN